MLNCIFGLKHPGDETVMMIRNLCITVCPFQGTHSLPCSLRIAKSLFSIVNYELAAHGL